ncbi:Luciferase-like monooxygenase, YwcH [Thermobacillus xylanilyticus]|jgi:luciferase family oxidoreductase group 1|uniref:Luciferase-like monooxygenase, YwcH n=1 Tax=Thermobacillus xylanilyticus TaxID=76633 RepID=A0ABN7RJS1_THEXY|nr:LLM class flavin-dependent oxidoreductase [Thermobacillus xylanilyticus]CAG5079466.1 Luciferase-like monooxygenase, YwcH [Thermobacillus xylanilyticus]
MIKLGILDQSQVGEGKTSAEALRETTRLAIEAERMGYSRFWMSEHHGSRSLAHSSPEIMIAHVAAATRSIRVGSGGVMLPHYSAYKVAENFRLLEALHPGRIDLGLGRAPGGRPLSTRALHEGKTYHYDQYPQQVLDLIDYFQETTEDHRFPGLFASPSVDTHPEIWLLGSSDESARIAAQLGTAYGFAQFFGTPGGAEAIRWYKEHFRPQRLGSEPRALAAVLAICAETEEEANDLALSTDLYFLGIERGFELPYLPTVETARNYPYTEFDLELIRRARSRRIIGTPGQVREALERLAEEYAADELLIVSPIHDFAKRLASFRLIAEAFGLAAKA